MRRVKDTNFYLVFRRELNRNNFKLRLNGNPQQKHKTPAPPTYQVLKSRTRKEMIEGVRERETDLTVSPMSGEREKSDYRKQMQLT